MSDETWRNSAIEWLRQVGEVEIARHLECCGLYPEERGEHEDEDGRAKTIYEVALACPGNVQVYFQRSPEAQKWLVQALAITGDAFVETSIHFEYLRSWKGIPSGEVERLEALARSLLPAKGAMPMNKKFQVFISSTYQDLQAERQKLTLELLGGDYIPAGMENFAATDDRGWGIIKRTIESSDYYVLIVGGRYGSVDPASKLSWTEKEYNFALEQKIPVLAFVRADAAITADKFEGSIEGVDSLKRFKARLRDTHHAKEWTSADDLVNKVQQALTYARNYDAPRPGWIRGAAISSAVP